SPYGRCTPTEAEFRDLPPDQLRAVGRGFIQPILCRVELRHGRVGPLQGRMMVGKLRRQDADALEVQLLRTRVIPLEGVDAGETAQRLGVREIRRASGLQSDGDGLAQMPLGFVELAPRDEHVGEIRELPRDRAMARSEDLPHLHQRLPVNPLGLFEAATPEQMSSQMGACLRNGRVFVAKYRRAQSQRFAIELLGFVESILLIKEDGQVAEAVRSAQVIAPEGVLEEGKSVAVEL